MNWVTAVGEHHERGELGEEESIHKLAMHVSKKRPPFDSRWDGASCLKWLRW